MPDPDEYAKQTHWWDLTEGQTEQFDDLRMHLMSAHSNLAALHLTDDEASDHHAHEHRGPGTIRNHDPASTTWSEAKLLLMILDQEPDHFLVDEDKRRLSEAFHAHQHRHQTRQQIPEQPGIYQHVSRITVSVLPSNDPWYRHYRVHVVEQTDGSWSVEHGESFATATGEWLPNVGGIPREHLFTCDDALMLARKLAPDVHGGGGYTARQVLALPVHGRSR